MTPTTAPLRLGILGSGKGSNFRAIADAIEEELTQNGEKPLAMEGYHKGTWVLIDCADVIVHVFDDETRRFYNLERLWHRAARVEVPGVAFAMPQTAASEALLVEEG